MTVSTRFGIDGLPPISGDEIDLGFRIKARSTSADMQMSKLASQLGLGVRSRYVGDFDGSNLPTSSIDN